MLKTLDYTIGIGSTPTFLYFNFIHAVFIFYLYYNDAYISRNGRKK